MKVVILTKRVDSTLFPAADRIVLNAVEELDRHRDADLYVDLDFAMDAARLSALSRMLPSPVMVNAVTTTIAEIGHPFIRINGWPGMLERTVHELVVPHSEAADEVGRLYEKLGHSLRIVPDIPGMVTPRMLAVLINEAWYTFQQGVSSKDEIDTAMRLGTNYPMGLFEWGAHIGLSRIVELLEVMSETDPRYIPADSLKKAGTGIKI